MANFPDGDNGYDDVFSASSPTTSSTHNPITTGTSSRSRKMSSPPTSATDPSFHPLTSSLTSASAGSLRLYLQSLLDQKEKQLQQAGALGQRVLAQQVELEERVRELQEMVDGESLGGADGEENEVGAEMREKVRGLARSVQGWEAENGQLSGVFGKVGISFYFYFWRFFVCWKGGASSARSDISAMFCAVRS